MLRTLVKCFNLLNKTGPIYQVYVENYITGTPWSFYTKIFKSFNKHRFLSLPVVGLTTIFTGAALALQIYSGGTRFNAESVVPSIVAINFVESLGCIVWTNYGRSRCLLNIC